MANGNPSIEYTTKDLDSAWKKVDVGKFNMGLVWSLNSPICLSEIQYSDWLVRGRDIYGENNSFYLNRVAQEEFHREQVRSGRSLDKRKIA